MKLVKQVLPAGSTRHIPNLCVTITIGSVHNTGSLQIKMYSCIKFFNGFIKNFVDLLWKFSVNLANVLF